MGDCELLLVIPGLFYRFSGVNDQDLKSLGLDPLLCLLSRASKLNEAKYHYQFAQHQQWLYRLFGAQPTSPAIPYAPLSALWEGLPADQGGWMRADPVHLHPDIHSLILQDPSDLQVQPHEQEMIIKYLTPLLEDIGVIVHTPHPQRWYFQFTNHVPQLRCVPVDEAVGRPINTLLPQGEDARQWHVLFNEIQMLLSALPLNQARQRTGRLPINSLWFWGSGVLPTFNKQPFDLCIGDSPLLKFIMSASGREFKPMNQGLTTLAQYQYPMILDETLYRACLGNDGMRWLDALKHCTDHLIAPLLDLLRHKQIQSLHLISDAKYSYRCSHRQIRSFWQWNNQVGKFWQ